MNINIYIYIYRLHIVVLSEVPNLRVKGGNVNWNSSISRLSHFVSAHILNECLRNYEYPYMET